ncbi:biotin carboxylase N-terminal domain-containing protein [Variovorax sp. 770b2]|uniref:ATP-binding protein n=1 Tax=Variovorax sp. 770b2 TaxID=1566271 RepID=UPI0008DFA480|nr:biotin carboxylase N-terminal domain-containing protein [Variovorax sp. 770b2]SFQ01967.1 acetyl-CoA carboxylase, biotin carboxylase subunit [Variovorax sp. 770b2]
MRRLLIANRGAIAARILRAAKALGMESIAVYSDADRDLPYLAQADHRMALKGCDVLATYLNQNAILDIARLTGAHAIHPGCGALAENAVFARRVEAAGMRFIGPSSRWIDALHGTQARALVAGHGMPMGPSSSLLGSDLGAVRVAAERIGYPVLVKAAGGNGIDILPIRSREDVQRTWRQAGSIAARSFGHRELYLEKLLVRPRHIELQYLADRHGGVRFLYERDCSVQRRHQKIIEEARAPRLDAAELAHTGSKITGLLSTMGYDGIGTVEMRYTPESGFVFLQLNTGLQIQHAVTEEVTGIDIVQAQIRLACGERIDTVAPLPIASEGHSIEARVYAEDPLRFLPSTGFLNVFAPPHLVPGIRVETGYAQGCTVSRHYDTMLATVTASAPTREAAIASLQGALAAFEIRGVETNLSFVDAVLGDPAFKAGHIDTSLGIDLAATRLSGAKLL